MDDPNPRTTASSKEVATASDASSDRYLAGDTFELKERWIAEDDAVLIQMAAQGWTVNQVARKLRRTSAAVRDRAKTLGVTFGRTV